MLLGIFVGTVVNVNMRRAGQSRKTLGHPLHVGRQDSASGNELFVAARIVFDRNGYARTTIAGIAGPQAVQHLTAMYVRLLGLDTARTV